MKWETVLYFPFVLITVFSRISKENLKGTSRGCIHDLCNSLATLES